MGQIMENNKKEENKLPQKHEGTVSERFTNAVIREFGSIAGKMELTPYQKRLAQHLFIKIDNSLNDLEKKRQDKNKDGAPIVWANINMQKLAVDAVHRVELGLDALIPNHISPIPYWNSRQKKYDLDLRVGYAGKDYYRRQVATEQPKDIIYELVRKNDIFMPIKKSQKSNIETYQFEIPAPFNRGPVIGGFAYLEYEDASKNKLVIVTEEDFKKSEGKAQSREFWGSYPDEMRYKTLVIKGTNKLQVDPAKVNSSFAAVEQDDLSDAASVAAEIEGHANTGEVMQIEGAVVEDAKASDRQEGPIADDTPQPPVCVCDEMLKEGQKSWDCPLHGRYQSGKFTKDLFGSEPAKNAGKKGPGF